MQAKVLLFDMDGTLIDSSRVIENIWRSWAMRHGIDVEELLSQAHGRRAIETVRRFAPVGIDPVAEAETLNLQAAEEMDGIVAITGAQSLIQQLATHEWAIVTRRTSRTAHG
jgi:sugar-phosphatase